MNSQLDFFIKPDVESDEEPQPRVALDSDRRKSLAEDLQKRFNQSVSISVGIDYVIAKIGSQYVELQKRGEEWLLPEKSSGIAPFKVEGKLIHALVN